MKCAIYTRVSTDKEEQKQSLENQKELFINYVKEKNWEIYDFYVDIESGTTANRENLQRLINDVKCRKFDVILAKELSRLARNGQLSHELKNLADSNNVHIITLDNAINTLTGNRDMFGLYAWMYEQESERISRRVKSALKTKYRRGEYKGSIPPYGYYIQEGKLFVCKDSSPDVVRYIFKSYLAGDGFDKIAKNLFEKGTPTPSQHALKANASPIWHGSTIKKILQNAHYIGDLVQGRETSISVTVKKRKSVAADEHIICSNSHEAIISRDTFDAVQQLIKSRKIIRPAPNKHLFSNILFCADCGSGMHYKANRKGYVCGAYDKRGTSSCTSHIVREIELQEAILSDINTIIEKTNQQSSSDKIQDYIKKQEIQLKKKIKALTSEIQLLNTRKNNALEFLLNKTLTREEYLEQTSSISAKIIDLEDNVAKNTLLLETLNQDEILKEIKKISECMSIKELTPEILNQLIAKVEITEDGEARIYYRFSLPSVYL